MQKLLVHALSDTFDKIEIYPTMDLHFGDIKTDYKLFQTFLKFILAEPYRFITIQGDMINNATRSGVSDCFDDTPSPQEQKKWLINELRPLAQAGRILCYLDGNHEARNTKETSNRPMEDVAIALGNDELYFRDAVFMKVAFGKGENGKRVAYTLACIHGVGGGIKSGSSVNRIEDWVYSIENLDIGIMGHVHRKIAGRPEKQTIDTHNENVYTRPMLWVIAAPWQDYGGYAMRMMLKPSTKGSTPIYLSGRTKEFHALI